MILYTRFFLLFMLLIPIFLTSFVPGTRHSKSSAPKDGYHQVQEDSQHPAAEYDAHPATGSFDKHFQTIDFEIFDDYARFGLNVTDAVQYAIKTNSRIRIQMRSNYNVTWKLMKCNKEVTGPFKQTTSQELVVFATWFKYFLDLSPIECSKDENHDMTLIINPVGHSATGYFAIGTVQDVLINPRLGDSTGIEEYVETPFELYNPRYPSIKDSLTAALNPTINSTLSLFVKYNRKTVLEFGKCGMVFFEIPIQPGNHTIYFSMKQLTKLQLLNDMACPELDMIKDTFALSSYYEKRTKGTFKFQLECAENADYDWRYDPWLVYPAFIIMNVGIAILSSSHLFAFRNGNRFFTKNWLRIKEDSIILNRRIVNRRTGVRQFKAEGY